MPSPTNVLPLRMQRVSGVPLEKWLLLLDAWRTDSEPQAMRDRSVSHSARPSQRMDARNQAVKAIARRCRAGHGIAPMGAGHRQPPSP